MSPHQRQRAPGPVFAAGGGEQSTSEPVKPAPAQDPAEGAPSDHESADSEPTKPAPAQSPAEGPTDIS